MDFVVGVVVGEKVLIITVDNNNNDDDDDCERAARLVLKLQFEVVAVELVHPHIAILPPAAEAAEKEGEWKEKDGKK